MQTTTVTPGELDEYINTTYTSYTKIDNITGQFTKLPTPIPTTLPSTYQPQPPNTTTTVEPEHMSTASAHTQYTYKLTAPQHEQYSTDFDSTIDMIDVSLSDAAPYREIETLTSPHLTPNEVSAFYTTYDTLTTFYHALHTANSYADPLNTLGKRIDGFEQRFVKRVRDCTHNTASIYFHCPSCGITYRQRIPRKLPTPTTPHDARKYCSCRHCNKDILDLSLIHTPQP